MRKLLAVLTITLSACAANPFTEFYRGTSDARKLPSYVAVPGDIKIYSTDNFERDVQELTRKSYSVVGRSSFSAASNNATDAQLREQARKIGAQIVLVRPGYTRTTYGALPLSSPQTTATPGSKDLLMPSATMPSSDLAAAFLVKLFPRVGLSPGALDDETRRRLKRNGGILVLEVVEGSPAFNADVRPGDVLLARRVRTHSVRRPVLAALEPISRHDRDVHFRPKRDAHRETDSDSSVSGCCPVIRGTSAH